MYSTVLVVSGKWKSGLPGFVSNCLALTSGVQENYKKQA